MLRSVVGIPILAEGLKERLRYDASSCKFYTRNARPVADWLTVAREVSLAHRVMPETRGSRMTTPHKR